MINYPAILFPSDPKGLVGCVVPDLLINASGSSMDEALNDAAVIMDELLREMDENGEAFPEPTPMDEVDPEEGVLVVMAARVPVPSRTRAA